MCWSCCGVGIAQLSGRQESRAKVGDLKGVRSPVSN